MTATRRKALVTGGSGAIGREICARLAGDGFDVVLTYFSDRDGADVAAEAIREAGREAAIVRANFGDEANTKAAIEKLREHGPFDALISNAASGVMRESAELELRHWQWTLDVNARTLLLLAQAFADSMPRGSSVVALSSLGATRAIPQYAAVGASKAAIESLVRNLAYELGPRGIAVNAVSPGIVMTKALDHFPNKDDLIEAATRKTPMKRLTTPTDVANVVSFLCSGDASMITGQTLHVDGGYSSVA